MDHHVQACAALPVDDWRKEFAYYASYFNYATIFERATACGLPASTVKLTPPELDSCDGAIAAQMIFMR